MKLATTLLLACLSATVLAQQPAPPKPVQVQAVKNTLFAPTIDIVGTIYSRHNVKLTAGINGRLDWVAEPGTFLSQGEVVAKVDQLPLSLQQAEQQAQIKRAQINLTYLKRELARLKELRQSNSASAFQHDQTASQYELAQADLEIAKLKLQQIDDQLSRTHIKAPFTGVITERLREAGGDVNRGEVLVQMLDTENLEGRLFVPVKYLSFIRQTQDISVTANGQHMQARVKAVIPSADTRSQSFELRVSLPADSNRIWTAGQHIKAQLPTQQPRHSLSVHRDALILREDGTYVVVIDKNNKALRKAITVGEGQDDWVRIQTGDLHSGDKVAIRGAERLRDGEQVVIN